MIPQFISGFVRNEVADLKRGIAGMVIVGIAAVLLLVAVCFTLFALYFWLSAQMAAWKAALVVAAIILAASLLLGLVGRVKMHRPQRRQSRYQQEMRALASSMVPGPPSRQQKLTVIASAAVIGLIVGRRLSG